MIYYERNLLTMSDNPAPMATNAHIVKIDLLSDDLYHVTFSTPNSKGFDVCKPTAHWDRARDALVAYAAKHGLRFTIAQNNVGGVV